MTKPRFTYTPKPTFRTQYEREKYWDIEKQRWVEGHQGLVGMHYFYLTQIWIKEGTDGNYIRPSYRDCDEWIIGPLHDSFWNAKGAIGLIKRREIGATSIGCGMLPFYTMRLFPGSTFGMTSCDQPRISKAFSDKTMVALGEMEEDIRPMIDRKNESKATVFLRLAWKVKGQNDQQTIQYSELYSKETADSIEAARGFSGTRMRAAYYDEFPLHKRKNILLGSSLSCFMNQSVQTGLLFWAGTCEDSLTNEQIYDLQTITNDSKNLNTQVIFAPGWWGLMMDSNGISNEKKGIEWIMKERERYDRLEDKSYLKAFIKNYPLSLDEIFNLGAGAFFEDDVVEMIKVQLDRNRQEDPPIAETKNSIATIEGRTESVPSKNGKFTILEHPKNNVEYVCCVDGTGSGKVSGEDQGSNVAAIIYKLFDPDGISYCPVCYYYERPSTVEASYINIVNECRYYNRYGGFKKISAEGNQGLSDHFSTFLNKEGLSHWILYRKDLTGKGNSNENKPFQYITVDVRNWQQKQMNSLLRRHIHNYKMKTVLNDFLKPTSENADLRDASLMFPIYMGKDWDKPVQKPKPTHRKISVLEFDSNGETRWVDKVVAIKR